MRFLPWMMLATLGCSPSDTAVRLVVTYDSSWSLDGFAMFAEQQSTLVGVAHRVRMILPDTWADRAIAIELWGLKGSQRWAWGSVTVTPVRNREVTVEIALTRLPCGAWCTEDATSCDGDGVAVCTRNELGCTDWGAATPCPSDKPYCSLGTCLASCIDECMVGEARCDGPNALVLCGPRDSCFAWQPALPCQAGEVCTNGACRAMCQDGDSRASPVLRL